ncbi:MAG: hypothetical protein ACM3Q2_16225 [Syntrophothermus sp.]
MDHENKNHLLDLFFLEGKETEYSELKEHVAGCENCREYLCSLQQTMNMLSRLEDEEPGKNVFNNILSDISPSVPIPSNRKKVLGLMPVLQIVFGEMFLFALIYFIKLQITIMPFWKSIENNWIIQSIGSIGVSVIIVLAAGSFIALSLAPVLLFESEKRNSFN